MYIDFSTLFHQSSRDGTGQGSVFIPENSEDWPKEWSTTYYKIYELDSIKLSDEPIKADLFDLLRARHSERNFSKRPMMLDQMSTLLKYSCGIMRRNGTTTARAYPSGGARFPLEIYPIVFAGSASLPAGIYHYDVKHHALDVLHQREFSAADIGKMIYYDFAKNASCAIVMTAVFQRNQMKYHERGYRYVLLEAGHAGQNLYLTSAALGLGCCAMGGLQDVVVEKMLDVDGLAESVVYGLLIG